MGRGIPEPSPKSVEQTLKELNAEKARLAALPPEEIEAEFGGPEEHSPEEIEAALRAVFGEEELQRIVTRLQRTVDLCAQLSESQQRVAQLEEAARVSSGTLRAALARIRELEARGQ